MVWIRQGGFVWIVGERCILELVSGQVQGQEGPTSVA